MLKLWRRGVHNTARNTHTNKHKWEDKTFALSRCESFHGEIKKTLLRGEILAPTTLLSHDMQLTTDSAVNKATAVIATVSGVFATTAVIAMMAILASRRL